VLNVEIQTSFRHSRITFFKKLWTKKSYKIKIAFISKNPFDIWRLQSKVMDKVQRRVGRDIFFDILKHPLWILSITSYWRLQMSNGFLEMKVNLIWQLFLVQSFLKKVILPCPNGLQSLLFLQSKGKTIAKTKYIKFYIAYKHKFAWCNGWEPWTSTTRSKVQIP